MEHIEISALHQTTQLVIQLSIIIIVAWGSNTLMHKIHLPRVIGYILTGIIIGPFLLGQIPITSIFPDGIFPFYNADEELTRAYIHEFASVASILLLFHAGLETDVNLFVRYAFKGSIIGLGGIIFSFAGGYYVSTFFFPELSTFHPAHLFMGTVATATSVSITTSILSSKQKMTSPEGVTMLSAAVLDDVVGVIILAVVTGIAGSGATSKSPSFTQILIISIRALAIWLSCTAIGILFARKFGQSLKKTIRSSTQLAIFVVGIALLVGGLFETMGLSMIIGAYIVGLTLSNTDLSYVIQEKISPILVLFVPIFFIISGMNINIFSLIKPQILLFGLTYSIVCMVAKFLGGSLPALATGFTFMGAARIGSGMMPRGEVALIIGSIGLTSAVITHDFYNAITMMIIFNATLSPIILNILLTSPLPSTKKITTSTTERTVINFKHISLTRFIIADFLSLMEEEGFFVNKTGQKDKSVYHIRRDSIFITLHHLQNEGTLVFYSEKKSVLFFRTALHEAVSDIAESAQVIKNSITPKQFINADTDDTDQEAKNILSENNKEKRLLLKNYMSPFLVKMCLQSSTKEKIIQELSEPLETGGFLINGESFVKDVLEREKTFSTGLQNGIAMPHAKSNSCKQTKIVIGLKPEGINFDSLDGKLSTIFVLIAAPLNTPHLSILTQLSTLLNSDTFRKKLIECKNATEVVHLFTA